MPRFSGLTVHKARDVYPRFSPDGKWIAFSSDRYGNYDVFVIPAEGWAISSTAAPTAPGSLTSPAR